MKRVFYVSTRAALLLSLSSVPLIGAGCNRSQPVDTAGYAEINGLMLQATQVRVPTQSAPTSTVNGNTSTTTMTFGTRVVELSEQDKKGFADNLTFGKAVDRMSSQGDKTSLMFTAPNSIIVWRLTNDQYPGMVTIDKFDGPVSPNAKLLTQESYELSAASNTFGLNWLAAHPQ